MFENVTNKNALVYAMKAYDNPQCLNAEEFQEDYERFKYIKRLCRRYLANERLSERLMLNHLVLLNNVFGADATVRLLFLKLGDARYYVVMKPFLKYMDLLPDVVPGVDGQDIYTDAIPLDKKLWMRLQEL